jgi:hypothetical protein
MTAASSIRHCVRGTNLSYASLAEWLDLVYRIGGRIQCSRTHYSRFGRLYRNLGAGDIRASRDIPTLAVCERLFHRARGAGERSLWPRTATRIVTRRDWRAAG